MMGRYGVDIRNACGVDVRSPVVGEVRVHKIDVRSRCSVRIIKSSRKEIH